MDGWSKNRLATLGLYLLLIPMWTVVTSMLRAESTLAVYAGVVTGLTYFGLTAWFTYISFFKTVKETKTSDAE